MHRQYSFQFYFWLLLLSCKESYRQSIPSFLQYINIYQISDNKTQLFGHKFFKINKIQQSEKYFRKYNILFIIYRLNLNIFNFKEYSKLHIQKQQNSKYKLIKIKNYIIFYYLSNIISKYKLLYSFLLKNLINQPFIERFRPQTLEDVAGNTELKLSLKTFIQNGNIPDLLFSSPPGTGKTTLAYILARTLLKENYKRAFIEINASDERNVSVIKDKVKIFAQLKFDMGQSKKIIFLDECDLMTTSAQMALRRLMEQYRETTTWILCCNDIQKVVQAVQSRCCCVQLQRPTENEIALRLEDICKKLNIQTYTQPALKLIAKNADSDVRRAVNDLQTVYYSSNQVITEETVKNSLDFIQDNFISVLLQQQSFTEACLYMHQQLENGFTINELITAFYRYGIDVDNKMSDVIRAQYLRSVADCQSRIALGVSSELQLQRMLQEIWSKK